METDNQTQVKLEKRIPRLKDDSFDLRDLSMREFEAYMIVLIYDGEVQSTLKRLIDVEFDHTSTTKGYDYINNLCKKGFTYKKKTVVNGRQVVRVYAKANVRKKYEKYMIPTIKSLKISVQSIIEDYIEGIKVEEKIREKFKAYTDTIILALSDLIKETSSKTLNSQRFQKKIYDTIRKYFRAEILKYEVFSK